MTRSPRRTVITGQGAVTPLGIGAAPYWDGLRAGRSGVGPVTAFDTSTLPVHFGGEVRDFDARDFLAKSERKQLKMMVRTTQLAVAAARLAADSAGLAGAALDHERFGVLFGSGTIPGELADLGAAAQASFDGARGIIDLRRWGRDGLALIPPMWLLNHVPNMVSCHVSILHDARGPSNTITQTDVAALLALGEARRALRRGRADVFLAGGADTRVNPVSFVRQCLYAPLSRRNDAPARACRPFERGRDGLVLGEGAAALVLEDLEHAQRRGARVDAELVGFGAAFDCGRTGAGLARAVAAALDEAGIGPDDLDHVNAHGDGSPRGDAWEARGLRAALGGAADVVPVFAAKSYFGHLGAGSGAVELVASLLALAHGLLPATLNHDEPDPDCPITVAAAPRPVGRPYVLKVGVTDRGQCAALVCRKWD
jgi:3-oxoacyl-[acyl-carrier-protein] synthase II